MLESLRENEMDPKDKKVVILGAGGAAKAISVELALAGASEIVVVARKSSEALATQLVDVLAGLIPASSYVEWAESFNVPADTDIFINATPVGMAPDYDVIPNIVPESILPSMFVQDVIPNPAVTALLKLAEQRGAKWSTGMGMLANQAALNTRLWTGLEPNRKLMFEALKQALEG